MRFGHRLWCEINVRAAAAPEIKPKSASSTPTIKHEGESSNTSSTMIFPKLEKESPSASMHEDDAKTETTFTEGKSVREEGFEDCDEDVEWDGSEGGFMTDEEYDILDASDEEFLEEQERKLLKK